MKKVVVFGGGTGLSFLLSGLKEFPLDVTTIIAVSDNGSSTGVLKEELDIPAVGDVGKVLLSMANVDEDFVKLLGYRFEKEGSLHHHPVRNILLAALIDLKGNLTEATNYMASMLKVKGTVLPLTEEKVELVGQSRNETFFGEEEVSQNVRKIRRLTYDHDITVSEEIRGKILDADLIIFSPGSLYTSIIPHLIAHQVTDALKECKAPIMYVCNLFTQPGETDNFTVSRHIKALNKYLDGRKIDCVLANTGKIDKKMLDKYADSENKKLVKIDAEKVSEYGARLIESDIIAIDKGTIKHDALKTAFMIFSYLME